MAPVWSFSCITCVMCRSTGRTCACSWDSRRENPQAGYPRRSKNLRFSETCPSWIKLVSAMETGQGRSGMRLRPVLALIPDSSTVEQEIEATLAEQGSFAQLPYCVVSWRRLTLSYPLRPRSRPRAPWGRQGRGPAHAAHVGSRAMLHADFPESSCCRQ